MVCRAANFFPLVASWKRRKRLHNLKSLFDSTVEYEIFILDLIDFLKINYS